MAHWYRRNGKSCYEQPKAGGGSRPTTLADARKIALVPSVTTIIGMLAKPYLDTWKLKILAGIAANSEQYWETAEDLLRLGSIEFGKAAIRGDEIHDHLETYFRIGKLPIKDADIITPALNMLSYKFNGQKWVPEEGFAHKAGFGGKVDLHSKKGNLIIDFKTKSKDILDPKVVIYDDYCMQLAAYREGLALPDAKCYNLVISTTSPGTVLLHPWSEEQLKRGWKLFKLLLEVWKIQNNFDSGWEDDDNEASTSAE